MNFLKQYRKIFLLIFLFSFLTFLFLVLFSFDLEEEFEKVKALENFNPSVTTKIYDKNDLLVAELFKQKRDLVPLEKISPQLIKAFIAIEDSEFYSHLGLNFKGIIRAFFINLFAGGIKQGGSTITQQLAKILLTSRKRNLARKIKEAFLALMLESNFSKEKILNLYLNQIFLGHGAYGIEAASNLYFNKHVWELNLAESSLLATLPPAPNRLSPIRHPKRSMQRHKIVLARMVEQGFISKGEAEESYSDFWSFYLDYLQDISPSLNTWNSKINRAPWFTEYIRQKLISQFGAEMVYEEGLQVYTTLDLKKQEVAQEKMKDALRRQTVASSQLRFKNEDFIIDNYFDEIVLFMDLFGVNLFAKKGLRANEKVNDFFRENLAEELEILSFLGGTKRINIFLDEYRKKYDEEQDFQKVEGALISIDHHTDYIETLIGGSEFSSINQLNRAVQARRQTGSSIKPLLYAGDLESHQFTAASTLLDSPLIYLDNEGGDWLPENYGEQYFGLVRLREALVKSINIISIKLVEALGLNYVRDFYAKLLRFSEVDKQERIPPNYSIALGSFELSPLELTRAYAILANNGEEVIPFSIRYVKNRKGEVVDSPEEKIKKFLADKKIKGEIQVLSPEVAQIMTSILKDVVSVGTGARAALGRPAAGKTGTTNNWRDAWFVGYTPEVTTGIWIGYDKMGLSLGIGQSGGSVAAPIWKGYMQEILKGQEETDFQISSSLVEKEICPKSGLLASPFCRVVTKEYFVEETIPALECDVCEEKNYIFNPIKKGPKENISALQKELILDNLKKREKSIIKYLNNDFEENDFSESFFEKNSN